jgi:MOSC domain-containing protein YiiM
MAQITLLVGKAAPLPGSDQPSGIAKHAVDRPLRLGPEGLEGDEQADRRVHGGLEKAVHHYPFDHYAAWAEDLAVAPDPPDRGPAADRLLPDLLGTPGAFGENVSTLGMAEADLAVGDIFRLGTALVQVSQGRQPCWKLSRRFGMQDMARQVQDSGRTGWYYRVLEAGIVAPDAQIALIDRVAAEWSLPRLWRAFYVDGMNLSELRGIATLEVLAESWRRHALRRLESGRIEDWSQRLEGDA